MRRYFATAVLGGLVMLAAGPASAGARPDKIKSWFGHVAAGYSVTNGTFGDIADNGWVADGGAVFWPESWPVGLNFDLGYSQYDVSNKAINFINDQIGLDPMNSGSVTGGDVDVWSTTADVMWGPDTGRVGFYLLGGIGVDYIDGKVTSQGLVYYPGFCDPWWWWCYPGGVGTGTIVQGSEDTTEFSYNVGIGLTFEVNVSGSQVYIESRYKFVNTDRETTEYLPIVVGFRW